MSDPTEASLDDFAQAIAARTLERMKNAEESVTRLRAEIQAMTEERDRLRDAAKGVQFFHSDGIVRKCDACGAEHFFSDGPPVVIRHKPGCWGAAILEALALNVSEE